MTLEATLERIAVALEKIAANTELKQTVSGPIQVALVSGTLPAESTETPEKQPTKSRSNKKADKDPSPAAPASTAPAPQPTTAPSPEPAAAPVSEAAASPEAPAAPPAVTFADVQAAAHAYAQIGNRDGVMAIFKELGGISNLKDLNEDRYPEAVKKFNDAAELIKSLGV